jgi:phosphate transport system protein
MTSRRSSPGDHTVRSYDDELAHLSNLIARMGGIAESQLASALQALAQRDSDLAGRIVANDAKVDELDKDVYAFAVRMLALRQPVAQDLRHIVSALKISGELERMADYAANMAKRVLVLNGQPPCPTSALLRIGRVVQEMAKDVLDAYVERDVDKALAVRARDGEVDEMYTGLVRELITYMIEDARTINACTHLLFMAKNLERIGDHATNVAEIIHFLVHGTTLKEARRKGDRTSEPGILEQE